MLFSVLTDGKTSAVCCVLSWFIVSWPRVHLFEGSFVRSFVVKTGTNPHCWPYLTHYAGNFCIAVLLVLLAMIVVLRWLNPQTSEPSVKWILGQLGGYVMSLHFRSTDNQGSSGGARKCGIARVNKSSWLMTRLIRVALPLGIQVATTLHNCGYRIFMLCILHLRLHVMWA